MSRSSYKKHSPEPDPVYHDVVVSKFVNQVMEKGKKNLARTIVYGALEVLKQQTKQDPLEVFHKAIENVAPLLEVRSKRVGGATYQVPVEVQGDRRMSLAMRWIIGAAVAKKKKQMQQKLAEELLLAFKNEGSAVKKREDVHRMAEANRAFAHLAR
ncbi:MAG: 30S ribosomal protein S7 [Candidatus Wildermuthbacteria bacterium]|nr:30S ribosomal protein S7 [Candidatus Wildermuthbacteria bacterium]